MWRREAMLGCILICIGLLVMCSQTYAGCEQVKADAVKAMECKQARGVDCKASLQKKGLIYHDMRISLYQYPLHFGEKWQSKVIQRYSSHFYEDCKRGQYGTLD